MSGILGIWNVDDQPVDRVELKGFAQTLRHRGPHGLGLWVEGPIGLACQIFRVTPESGGEGQPYVDPSGVVIVFDGRLDNRDEIMGHLGGLPVVSADSPDSFLVVAAYHRFGESLSDHLVGDFAFGLFDPRRQRLLIVRDAIGVRPLYYCRIGQSFLFASEIKALLAHPKVSTRPNRDAIAELALRFPNGARSDSTFFEGILTLPPAHEATVTRNGFVKRRYWDFDLDRETRFHSLDEYSDAFRDQFARAVNRRTRGSHPIAVSVSGGLDSSSIFCVGHELARGITEPQQPLIGITFSSADGTPSDENVFVVDIEQKYGVAIQRVALRAGFLDGIQADVYHSEIPFLNEQSDSTKSLYRTATHMGARTLLTGHWGDQALLDQSYLVNFFRRLKWTQIRSHLREYALWNTDADPKFFWRNFYQDLVRQHVPEIAIPFLKTARARLGRPGWDHEWYTDEFRENIRRHSFARNESGPAVPLRCASLYQTIRSSYHVMCMEWNNKAAAMFGLETAFPFLDRDLLSFLMSVPGEVKTSKGVPKALLRRAMRGILPDSIAGRRWKADFTHVVNAGVEQDYSRVIDMLSSDAAVARWGFVKPDVLSRELFRLKSRLSGGDAVNSWMVSDLLALEIWLRVFFEGETTAL